MPIPTSVSRIRWSPHSDGHRQQFLRVNTRNHELGLYEVVESVSAVTLGREEFEGLGVGEEGGGGRWWSTRADGLSFGAGRRAANSATSR